MESSILKVFVCVVFFVVVYFLFCFQCKLIFPSRYSLLYIPHSVMSTFSHTVYINGMKQKGLPLVSNKAAPCTVLSHSLVDSAPHVHRKKRTDTYRQMEASHTTEPLTYGTSHVLLLCYISLPPPCFLSGIKMKPTLKFNHLSKRVHRTHS